MTSYTRRRAAQRRTVGRWLDDLIRSIERRAEAPDAKGQAGAARQAVRPSLRLRRDLELVLGL